MHVSTKDEPRHPSAISTPMNATVQPMKKSTRQRKHHERDGTYPPSRHYSGAHVPVRRQLGLDTRRITASSTTVTRVTPPNAPIGPPSVGKCPRGALPAPVTGLGVRAQRSRT